MIDRRKIIISWVCIFLVSLAVMYFSSRSPWLDDDIFYQFNYRSEKAGFTERIQTIGDIFESQYFHYQTTNGRFVAHSLVQLFDGLLGQNAFALCNGIVYILFIRLIMAICGVRISNWKSTLTVSCLVLLCLCVRMTPAFQMYIWMFLLTLTFIWLLLKYQTRKKTVLISLCLFSLLAGNGHESLNPGICVGVGLYFIVNRKEITLQQWLMYLFFCIGVLLIILSPGTQSRMGSTCPPTLEYRILALYILPRSLPASIALIFIMLYKALFRKENMLLAFRNDVIWWGTWGACMLIILYFGFSGGRSTLGGELVAVILILKNLKKESFSTFWLLLLVSATIGFIIFQWEILKRTETYLEDIRQQAIANADGNVFVNLSYPASIMNHESYSGRIEYMNVANEELCEIYMDAFSRVYSDKWDINRNINIYPHQLRPYIKHRVDTTVGNRVFALPSGMYLIVENRKYPARFKVHFQRKIIFFYKDFPLEDYDLVGIIYQDSLWRASVISKNIYHETYPATFCIEK